MIALICLRGIASLKHKITSSDHESGYLYVLYLKTITMSNRLLILLLLSVFISCDKTSVKEDFVVTGLKPVYMSLQNITLVESEPAREFGTLGKIISTGNFILINEQFKGVHLIDNSNPLDPTNLHFWKIPGNVNFTIKGNYLYADNTRDLLTVDISDPAEIKLVNRIENVRQDAELSLPDQFEGFFECVDYSLGIVTAWEEATLTNPKCRR